MSCGAIVDLNVGCATRPGDVRAVVGHVAGAQRRWGRAGVAGNVDVVEVEVIEVGRTDRMPAKIVGAARRRGYIAHRLFVAGKDRVNLDA